MTEKLKSYFAIVQELNTASFSHEIHNRSVQMPFCLSKWKRTLLLNNVIMDGR